MDLQQIKTFLQEEIVKYKEECFELNKYMATHPETSGQEFETSKKIVAFLREKGMTVQYPYLNIPTAFFAKSKAHSAFLVV